ncbi:MAG TPA: hypothetical protein VEZ71_29025, partial [Archangium sp.]|nr:hypothetical protein [Archangium sp.]
MSIQETDHPTVGQGSGQDSPGQLSKPSKAPPPMQADQRPPIERGAHLLALSTLKNAEIPFVVAGAYALHLYTGIYRDTKDLDLFLKREHVERAMEALHGMRFQTKMHDP